MKKIIIAAGGFGSGKTEISLNLAFQYAIEHKVTLVDLDIVNPFFRTTERKKEIEGAGIKLLSPTFTSSGVEIPALPADIYSAFADKSEYVIFDVGGDDTGAIALGQYKHFFEQADNIEFLYVVNARRPFSATVDLVMEMFSQIGLIGRLKPDVLVNNTNLGNETSVDDLLEGYELVRDVSKKTGLPVKYTVGTEDILKEFEKEAENRSFDKKYIGELLPITRYMHRDWDRFVDGGL